jgi:hypothetical protein
MRAIARVLFLALIVTAISCSGGSTVPAVQDYTSDATPVHAKPQSVCVVNPGQLPCTCGNAVSRGVLQSDPAESGMEARETSSGKVPTPDCEVVPPTPTSDPVYNIQCPGAESCTSSTAYNVGQPMSCVTDTGVFTTGCGGTPGSGTGVGIGVIYFPDATCYINFSTVANVCDATTNWTPGGSLNLTILYCYWAPLYQTQHSFTVPVTPAGRTAFARYNAYNSPTGGRFVVDEIPQGSAQYTIPWDPHTVFPPINASPSSLSEAVLWANGSGFVPGTFIGWAYALNTSQNCSSGITP